MNTFNKTLLIKALQLTSLIFFFLFSLLSIGTSSAFAHKSPDTCTGSGLGVFLFTDLPQVHVGDVIHYSITVFNNTPGSPLIACDASEIAATLVTPDGVSHSIPLTRTTLTDLQSDDYQNVASYTAKQSNLESGLTLNAQASVTGNIHQNDTDSQGGAHQEVKVTVVATPLLPFNISCPAIAGEVKINEEVTRQVEITGGTSPFIISWTGTDELSGSESTIKKAYSTTGVKEASVTVTDSKNLTMTKSCNTLVVSETPVKKSRKGGGGSRRIVTKIPVVTLVQTVEPAPLASEVVSLTEVPYTGINDYPKPLLFLLGVIIFSIVIVGTLSFQNYRSKRKVT
ncbi:MAG: hypothetical protein ABI430_03930 [Candidatus Taylorbacteria bacterium]